MSLSVISAMLNPFIVHCNVRLTNNPEERTPRDKIAFYTITCLAIQNKRNNAVMIPLFYLFTETYSGNLELVHYSIPVWVAH